MKTEEVRNRVIQLLKDKKSISSQEINLLSMEGVPSVQVYSVLKALELENSVTVEPLEGKKLYKLVDESKLKTIATVDPPEKKEVAKKESMEPTKTKAGVDAKVNVKAKSTGGRDLTTYKFNGETYSKGRLALAIVKQFATSKTSLAQVLKQFPAELVKPYGFVVKLEQAKKLSNPRPRFFLKDGETIKIKDATIAVSNQLDSTRIKAIIVIAKKDLGYTIK